MKAGDLSTPFILEQSSTTNSNPWETETPEWTTVGRINLYVRQASTNERIAAGLTDNTQLSKCKAWYDARITTDKRFTYNGKIYNILSVDNVENKNQTMEITIKESA